MDRRDGPLARALDLGHKAFWGIAIAGILVFLGTTWISSREANHEAGRRLAELRRQVDDARRTNDALAAEKDGLTSDPVHIERMLRRKFRMIGPDEVVIEPEEGPPAEDGP